MKNPLATASASWSYIQDAQKLGLDLSVRFDFLEFADIRWRHRSSRVSPYFDPKLSDFTADNAFWICGRDAEGNVVHLQAYRADLTGHFPTWFMNMTYGLHARRGESVEARTREPRSNPFLDTLGNQGVYLGEFWLSTSLEKCIGRRAVDSLGRMGLLLAHMKWDPDFVWSLASRRLAGNGFLQRAGFTYVQEDFVNWVERPIEAKGDEEVLAVVSRQDLENLADRHASLED